MLQNEDTKPPFCRANIQSFFNLRRTIYDDREIGSNSQLLSMLLSKSKDAAKISVYETKQGKVSFKTCCFLFPHLLPWSHWKLEFSEISAIGTPWYVRGMASPFLHVLIRPSAKHVDLHHLGVFWNVSVQDDPTMREKGKNMRWKSVQQKI